MSPLRPPWGQRRLFILGSLESSYWAPISHIWTFFASSNGWAAMSKYRVKIAVVEAGTHFDPKFQVEGDAPTNHSMCPKKTTWIYLSCGIRISADLQFVLSQFTRVTDRQTDTFAVGKTACILQRGNKANSLMSQLQDDWHIIIVIRGFIVRMYTILDHRCITESSELSANTERQTKQEALLSQRGQHVGRAYGA